MPISTSQSAASHKRKLVPSLDDASRREKKTKTSPNSQPKDIEAQILSLESSILESRKNYNEIVTLLNLLTDENESNDDRDLVVCVALCRIFCKLLALGELNPSRGKIQADVKIAKWLGQRLSGFEEALLQILASANEGKQLAALTLLTRLLQAKGDLPDLFGESEWRGGLFASLLQKIASDTAAATTKKEFVNKLLLKYHDIQYYTFACSADMLVSKDEQKLTASILGMLSAIPPPSAGDEVAPLDFFIRSPTKRNHALHSTLAIKKQAQRAWMQILQQDLDKSQRKMILSITSDQVAPWFLKVELLMDFLTDAFNAGGSMALTALSGLFDLIQRKNLDYPQFYPKLYSLLDADVLHSKHRSRFFRLLDTFLASTHLPAALVASFIKRLSRLSLQAPAPGIVFIVPWIYNLMKTHPYCTFMLHRNAPIEYRDEISWADPFSMDEADPMETRAIESSLWEIHTLQSHYHPNVAAIAKIISEQFTKPNYNLEDFLDHSYATMAEAELSKGLKKPPEIEYEIPKKIYTKYSEDDIKDDSLTVQLWRFD